MTSNITNGILYIVSTPIGNLQDITIRAIHALFSVDVILSERPAKTSQLLEVIKTEYLLLVGNRKKPKVISFNEFEEPMKLYDAVQALLDGKNIALVSEAGTPLLSDPGFKLVKAAKKKQLQVVTIPGVSSITAALSIAALPTDKFLFLGFPPKGVQKKQQYFHRVSELLQTADQKDLSPTVVFFESPHRIEETFETLLSTFGNIEITIARELTKIYEQVEAKSIHDWLDTETIKKPKGEFVVLFNLK